MVGTRRLELLTSTVSKLICSIPSTSYTTAGDRPNRGNTCKAKFRWIKERIRFKRTDLVKRLAERSPL
jgi:hypothetical protein